MQPKEDLKHLFCATHVETFNPSQPGMDLENLLCSKLQELSSKNGETVLFELRDKFNSIKFLNWSSSRNEPLNVFLENLFLENSDASLNFVCSKLFVSETNGNIFTDFMKAAYFIISQYKNIYLNDEHSYVRCNDSEFIEIFNIVKGNLNQLSSVFLGSEDQALYVLLDKALKQSKNYMPFLEADSFGSVKSELNLLGLSEKQIFECLFMECIRIIAEETFFIQSMCCKLSIIIDFLTKILPNSKMYISDNDVTSEWFSTLIFKCCRSFIKSSCCFYEIKNISLYEKSFMINDKVSLIQVLKTFKTNPAATKRKFLAMLKRNPQLQTLDDQVLDTLIPSIYFFTRDIFPLKDYSEYGHMEQKLLVDLSINHNNDFKTGKKIVELIKQILETRGIITYGMLIGFSEKVTKTLKD